MNITKEAQKGATIQESSALNLVNEQAEDDGLWFEARTANEAYLQAALRKLHAAVEQDAPTGAPSGKLVIKTADIPRRAPKVVLGEQDTPAEDAGPERDAQIATLTAKLERAQDALRSVLWLQGPSIHLREYHAQAIREAEGEQ